MSRIEPRVEELRDGGRVLLRAIEPDDADRLRAGFARLSPHSRYQRFLSSVDRLTDEQVRYLTDVDYSTHNAVVAIDVDAPDEPGIGVARYIRLVDEPDVAEAAVTVVDDHQGRGIGTLLLTVLAEAAREAGMRVFRNYVLVTNEDMRDLLQDLGGEEVRESFGIVEIDLPVGRGTVSDSPVGRMLREVARRGLVDVIVEHLPFLRHSRASEKGEPGSDPQLESEPWLRAWFDAAETAEAADQTPRSSSRRDTAST